MNKTCKIDETNSSTRGMRTKKAFTQSQQAFLEIIPAGMRDEIADFRVGQKSRFWKRDKTADFDNETKLPILKWGKTAYL